MTATATDLSDNPFIVPNAHVREYRRECEHRLGFERANVAFEEALRHPDYLYSRFRHGCVWAYRRAAESPSGVLLICGAGDVAFAEDALRRIRNNSPLSPTEGLQSSGARLY